MKRIAIITAIVLTTGLTAFSLSKKDDKTEVKAEAVSGKTATTDAILATAD
jgi:hypothetical protein